MNKMAFIYGAETQRLRKIIRKTRNKELYRRANAVLLVLEGHSKAEVARLLHAGRSSVNRWMTWYEVAGDDSRNQRMQSHHLLPPTAAIRKTVLRPHSAVTWLLVPHELSHRQGPNLRSTGGVTLN